MVSPTRSQAQPAYRVHDRDLVLDELPGQYILRVKDLPEVDRPREKMTRLGPEQLELSELIAVLWGSGTRKEEVMAMARRIVREYGQRSLSIETNPAKMAAALDIPEHKACQIIAGFELGRRFYASEAGRPIYIRTAAQAHRYVRDLGNGKKECLRALYLNSRYRLVRDEVVSVGSLTANIVHPREVFQPAITHGAVAVILAHNHPSGSPEPTVADIEVTRQLEAAGRLLGIELLDHLIVTPRKFVSLMEAAGV